MKGCLGPAKPAMEHKMGRQEQVAGSIPPFTCLGGTRLSSGMKECPGWGKGHIEMPPSVWWDTERLPSGGGIAAQPGDPSSRGRRWLLGSTRASPRGRTTNCPCINAGRTGAGEKGEVRSGGGPGHRQVSSCYRTLRRDKPF